MGKLIIVIVVAVFGGLCSIGLYFQHRMKKANAKQSGIVYCPRCDGSRVGRQADGGYICGDCSHKFQDRGHVPEDF